MLDCKPSGKNCKVTKINPQCPLHLTFSPAWDGTRERGKNSDKNRLTILNHMSYNNLTFESDRKTLRHDSYRRGRLGIQEMPIYNGFRGSRGKVSEYRERSGAFQPARTIRLRRQSQATDTSYSQSSRVGGRKGPGSSESSS